MKRLLQNLLIVAVYIILAFLLMYAIGRNAAYPAGADVMTHIYKGDLLYRSIRGGDFYPLYDAAWYNGIEPFRYFAPLPAYLLALTQAIAGGSAFGGYILFNGVLFFISAYSFLHVGNCFGRRWTGAFLGLIWFFTPCCLQLVYGQGDLARMLCLSFLPMFLYYLERFMREGELHQMLLPALFFLIFLLSEPYFARMIAVSLLVYLIIYAAANHSWKHLSMICVMLLAVTLLSSVWLLPSLTGRYTEADLREELIRYFQSGFHSLNPLSRIHETMPGEYYYGLAAFLIAVFGLFCAGRRSIPGFAGAVLLFFSTTLTMYPIFHMLPGATTFRMLHYLPIAACLILYSLLTWRTLKKPILIALCVLLTIDLAPSLKFVFSSGNEGFATTRFAEAERRMLLTTAKQITRQRLALMDLGELESDGTYLVTAYDIPLNGSFGSDVASAKTTYNITQLNRAYAGGQFAYLFDRTLELGNDSVLICLPALGELEEIDEELIAELDAGAARSGYTLADASAEYRLYHIDAGESFGVQSRFGAIGIGSGTGNVSLDFPTVEEVTSTNINDYSYEELSQYQTVYLNGFSYTDKEAAEEMLVRLSENGTRIVILADGIPQDPVTRAREFLGVMSQDVTFSNGYPELETTGWGIINTDLFPSGYTTWQTVYVTGLDEVYGNTIEDDVVLDFYGSVKNENIIVLALNLTYHYSLTKDASITGLLYEIFGMEIGQMPERRIVPVGIEYGKDTITITSPEEDVDIALAGLEIIEAEPEIELRNGLIHVGAGTTVLRLHYPKLRAGLLLSAAGALLLAALIVVCRRAQRREEAAAEEEDTEAATPGEAVPAAGVPAASGIAGQSVPGAQTGVRQ